MRARRRTCMVIIAACLAGAPAAAARRPEFTVRTSPYTVGQAVTWLDRTHVIYHDTTRDGEVQLFRSTLAGRRKTCLSCGLSGPNQVPVPQAHGRWVLFHSWNGHKVRLGSPGFGGIGSDVWVMTRHGKRRTNLTRSPELTDNFHAYWSPDGRYIVWTALNWNARAGGNGKSDVRVARFDPNGPHGPRLVGEHIVRPGNGHWYETQWWAPDGSGFLYTETYDTAINPELFFCRLPDPARGACHPVRLTHHPAWDEQAIFTRDMRRIVFMSSRNLPGALNDWSIVARFLELPARYDYALILSVFSKSFLQPNLQQATDLYEMSLRWNRRHTRFGRGPVRRLTRSGVAGWVIPEFAWDPSGTRLLWTESKFRPGLRVDQGRLVRRIRRDIIRRLGAVHGIGSLPLDFDRQIRDEATRLLRDPTGPGGVGLDAGNPRDHVARTRIGRYVGRP